MSDDRAGVSMVGPTHSGGPRFYRTRMSDEEAEETMRRGLMAGGPNLDLLDVGREGSAFRSVTEVLLRNGKRRGARYWPAEAGWVFEFDGVPSWDIAALMARERRAPDLSLAGVPPAFEIEYAVLAQIPTERIIAIHKVTHLDGHLERIRTIANPAYRPVGSDR